MTDMHNHVLPNGTVTASAPGGPHPLSDHGYRDEIEQLREDVAEEKKWAKHYQARTEKAEADIEQLRVERDEAFNDAQNAEADRCVANTEIERLRKLTIDEGMRTTIQILNAEAEIERLRTELAEERAKPKLTIRRVERQPLVIPDDE